MGEREKEKAPLSPLWRHEGWCHCDHGKRLACVVVRRTPRPATLLHVSAHLHAITEVHPDDGESYAPLSLWRPLCQRLNLSCLHLIVGSGRVDVRHDRVIKLRYFRRSGIMNDAYRNEDVIRHDLPNAIFFQH